MRYRWVGRIAVQDGSSEVSLADIQSESQRCFRGIRRDGAEKKRDTVT
jgi:hypothetical protein